MNTASGAGLVGYPGQSPYVSSKHGVLGLTKSAALEYGHAGLRVNAVCPGTVLTPMVEAVIEQPGLEAELVALHPIGRIGTARRGRERGAVALLRRRLVRARRRARGRRRLRRPLTPLSRLVARGGCGRLDEHTFALITRPPLEPEVTMPDVEPIPAEYPRVTPYLCVAAPTAAIDFYTRVLRRQGADAHAG